LLNHHADRINMVVDYQKYCRSWNRGSCFTTS